MTRLAAAASLLAAAVVASSPGGQPAALHTQAQRPPQPSPAADSGGAATAAEFLGPFPSWVNVRTAHGAAGDGVADDTASIQAALDALHPDGGAAVIFLPAGSYRITRTLTLSNQLGAAVVGEVPDRTRLVWDGPAGGTMLAIRGIAYSRVDRITFDGRGRAFAAVDQQWDNQHGPFDTGNQYADDRFIDVDYGIRGGFGGHGFAETSVTRARFVRNAKAGIALGNFNALDLWVWHSLFEDCGVGVTNEPGAGNYRVYHSVFRRSSVADLQMQNTGGFTARHNYSIGSNAFWLSGSPLNHPATIDIQGNTIIDPQSAVVVRMGNQGPGLIMDNRVRSLPGTSGPVISWSSLFGSDVVSIGNTFTVASAISANGRVVAIDDRTVVPSAIPADEPLLPPTPVSLGRRVFEVARGADTSAIQNVIDTAVREGGARPIVHFAPGRYDIVRTLVVPASDLQLVGDGMHTVLRWSAPGPGPVIRLEPPTRVTIEELQVDGGGNADGVVADDIDRPGARVHLEGVQLSAGAESNLLVDRTGRAVVQAVDIGHAYAPTGTSIRVIGGVGDSDPAESRAVFYSGASSGNRLSYDVTGRATLVARDLWYEGPADGGFVHVGDGAAVTLQGLRVATPSGAPTPAIVVDTQALRLTLLTTLFDDRVLVAGGQGAARVLALANLREPSPLPAFVNSETSPASALLMNLRQRTKAGGLIPRGTTAVADVGTLDAAFVREMLRDTRDLPPPALGAVPAGAADLRFFRVRLSNGRNNLVVSGPRR